MTFQIKEFQVGNLILGIAENIGPRIMKLTTQDRPEENLFGILPNLTMDTLDGLWHIYGGHRLWSSPEASPRSYSPDNAPVKITENNGVITIEGNPEPANSCRKILSITPSPKGGAEITHKICNTGRWPITMACWALSVMKTGGFAVIPFKGAGEGLLADRRMSVWPYTDLSDKRLKMEKDFIFLHQDKDIPGPIKIGTMAKPCWTAYCVDGMMFKKRFIQMEGAYPDFGCSVEVYTNAEMLELETVGVLRTVEPGEQVEHTEFWSVEKWGPGSSFRDML